MAKSIVFTIQKACLVNNVMYYQCDAPPALQIGELVLVAGCTTSTFNNAAAAVTVAAVGCLIVPNVVADTAGGFALWSGFTAAKTNANIAVEIEPTVPTDGGEGSPIGTATGTVTQ